MATNILSQTVPKRTQRVTKEIVGDFTVTTRPVIGNGSFGRVCSAEHNETNVRVAVKEITLIDRDQTKEYMFDTAVRELKILKHLKHHENIIKVLDFVLEEDTCWIFMELCNLGNLNTYLKNHSEIHLESKVKIFEQSASALAFMHRQKPAIIHRDLKPENILMTKLGDEEVLKLADFGLSKVFGSKHASSYSALFNREKFMSTDCGSHFFLAPEFFAPHKGTLQYDSSIDVFALGLVHKVVLEYCDTYRETIPVSVDSKQNKVFVNIATEMLDSYRQKQPMPDVVEVVHQDDELSRRIKRIIRHMTQFRSNDRKNIQEVEEEYKEILSYLHETARDSNKTPQKNEESIRNAKEQEAKKMTNKEVKPKPKDNKIGTPKLSMENQEPHKQTQEPCKEVKVETKQMQFQLSGLLLKKRWTERAFVSPSDNVYALYLIDDEIWCGSLDRIFIYSKDLKNKRVIDLLEMNAVYGIADVDGDKVAVAAHMGLIVIDRKGKMLHRLPDRCHGGVAVQNGSLYAISSGAPRAVHVYCTTTWKRKNVIKYKCTGISKSAHSLCASRNYLFLSCQDTAYIYKMSLDGKGVETFDHRFGPYVCMGDSDDNLLIANCWNDCLTLLHGKQIIVLQLNPPPRGPFGAAYDGNALFVAQCGPNKIVKYEEKRKYNY